MAGFTIEELRGITLFEGVSSQDLERVSLALHRKKFDAGAMVMSEEQPGELAYVVFAGTLKVHIEAEAEREVILAILGAGEIVGEMSLLDSLGRSATVETLEASVLGWMDRTTFWDCLTTMAPMNYNLARILSRRVRLANAQTQSLATLDVGGRLARQLLAFAREYGEEAPEGTRIPLRLTQSDLSDLVGASRVRVNQALAVWKRSGHINMDEGHRITIKNTAALQRRCR